MRHLFDVNSESPATPVATHGVLTEAHQQQLRRYFACTPWFEQAKLLSEERDSLVLLTGQLRDSLVRLENEKGIKENRERCGIRCL